MFDITAFTEHFPYIGIFVLLALGGVGLPFPEDTTLLLGGFLIAHGVIKPVRTFMVMYPTLLMTDFFLYWVGKKYGKKVVEHRIFQRIISPAALSNLEDKFKKRGILVVFFGRHFLGLRAQIFLVAGVMRMPAIKFLLTDAASAMVTLTFMVGIGYIGGNSIKVLKKDVTRIEHIVILFLVVLFTFWIIFRYFKNRKNLKWHHS
ncbi:MAG TPA: DedA family protein [Thermodesulfobacteriota bacterium]|nr:DedA family protein [Thermodesulfobacteriota bacterium]